MAKKTRLMDLICSPTITPTDVSGRYNLKLAGKTYSDLSFESVMGKIKEEIEENQEIWLSIKDSLPGNLGNMFKA